MDRFKGYISGLIGALITAIGTAYIFYGLTDIITKEKTIEQIIVSSALATFIGWIISILYSEMAFVHALANDYYRDAQAEKGKIISVITPHIDKVPIFCEKRNMQEFESKKKSLLLSVGISLDDYNNNLMFKDVKDYILPRKDNKIVNKKIRLSNKQTKKQNKKIAKIIKKINKAYIEEYSYSEIVNGVTKLRFKKARRATIDNYRVVKYSGKIISSLVTGVLFGYYGLQLSENPNWGMVIYLAIQFLSFNANGVFSYMRARSHVNGTMRDLLIEDTNKLYEFEASLKNNPDWYIKKLDNKLNEIQIDQKILDKIVL